MTYHTTDGLMRHTPDARAFIELAETKGVRAAVEPRDGPFGDYAQAPARERPDSTHLLPLERPKG